MISYDKLKATLEALQFNFFDSGDYNLNLIFERTNDEFTNYMTDLFHVAFKVGENKQVISIKCSTKPGLIGSVLNPVTVNGIKGTAVIVSPQQVKGGWYFIDEPTEDVFYSNKWNRCPYFRQNRNIDYWRDFNKNAILDRVQFQHEQFFGTHIHKGGEPINNYSLGCMIYPEKDFRQFILPVIRQAVKRYGKTFTGTIIESKNIL